jgi:hypothetical protein
VKRTVSVAAIVLEQAHERFGDQRSIDGSPSEYDFVTGPLAAAVLAFRGFDDLPRGVVDAVRTHTVVDHVFGPVVFAALLLTSDDVQVVDFIDDPGYWASIDNEW